MATSETTPIQEELGIDQYLRKRLMPVEGAIPQLPKTDMYGTPFPREARAGTSSSTSTFSSAITLMRVLPAPCSCLTITCKLFPAAGIRETPWTSTCSR